MASDGKGDYKVVVDQDVEGGAGPNSARASFTSSGRIQPATTPVDQLMNHPALPILCYCASSILMTVVNSEKPPPSLSSTWVSLNLSLSLSVPASEFVVSGSHFNMNFLLLTIQSVVCVSCVITAKRLGVSSRPTIPPERRGVDTGPDFHSASREQVINFRDWDKDDARKWFPISFMLVSVIYTGSKSLVRSRFSSLARTGFRDGRSRGALTLRVMVCSNTSRFRSTPSSKT